MQFNSPHQLSSSCPKTTCKFSFQINLVTLKALKCVLLKVFLPVIICIAAKAHLSNTKTFSFLSAFYFFFCFIRLCFTLLWAFRFVSILLRQPVFNLILSVLMAIPTAKLVLILQNQRNYHLNPFCQFYQLVLCLNCPLKEY